MKTMAVKSLRSKNMIFFMIIIVSSFGQAFAQLPYPPTSELRINQSSEEGEAGYQIGPQNLLQIRVLGEGNLQTTFRVDDQGFITHPLAGRIKLAGQSVAEAEAMLESILKDDYIRNPHITIFVLEHSRFSVLGEVRQPGNYEILGKVSIIQAISMAGGFTPVANERKIRILRKHENREEETIEIDVQDMIDGKKSDNVFVEPGDVINVPKSFF